MRPEVPNRRSHTEGLGVMRMKWEGVSESPCQQLTTVQTTVSRSLITPYWCQAFPGSHMPTARLLSPPQTQLMGLKSSISALSLRSSWHNCQLLKQSLPGQSPQLWRGPSQQGPQNPSQCSLGSSESTRVSLMISPLLQPRLSSFNSHVILGAVFPISLGLQQPWPPNTTVQLKRPFQPLPGVHLP